MTNVQSPLFSEFNQPKLVDAVEGLPIESEKVLVDEQLVAGGLVPVRAWMRTKPSANALRQAKKRENVETVQGKKQLNLVVPGDDASREALKAAAAALSDGRLSPEDLRVVSGLAASLFNEKEVVAEEPARLDNVRRIGLRVLSLRGWRRALVMWLIS